MTDDEMRAAIMDTQDPETFATLLFTYYRDMARATGTSRELMYLHLGMASGVIMRLVEQQARAKPS